MLLKKLYNKVYKVKRKDNGELFAVKYLHKAKILTIEDGQVKIKFGKLM
jgi:calcium-dependent protein kinase